MRWKYCRKLEPPEYGARTLQTTDGRATAYSEREREFTFAKKLEVSTCLCRAHGLRNSTELDERFYLEALYYGAYF